MAAPSMGGALKFRNCCCYCVTRKSRTLVLCCSNVKQPPSHTESIVEHKKILILGATGRVGGSTAKALAKAYPSLKLVLGGRNREKGAKLQAELGKNSEFLEVDIDNLKSLRAALNGIDLVVHATGPFQRLKKCVVLEAAIDNKIAYIDVSDDWEYSCVAKSLHEKALAAQVTAITNAGIYPGVSNLMAAELVRLAKSSNTIISEPERLRFSYFTEGSGGVGPTILATSFLLLGEEVVAYSKGKEIRAKPFSGVADIDFGKGVGKRSVYLINLPEVASAYEVLGVPTISARFGTAPFIWNWAMSAVARLASEDFLKDRKKIQSFANFVYPLIRVIDGFTGELISMRVDLECKDGQKAVALYTHKKMSTCVGVAISAFVKVLLEGKSHPGVWFPEEREGIPIEGRKQILSIVSKGTINFVLNRAPWRVETDPKEIGFGIYTN